MTKSFKTFKVEGYDKFCCIADRCKFTCCSGWDINVDTDTYLKWKNEESKCLTFLSNITCIEDVGYIMNKNTSETCPFLDNDKLCKIVKENGEDFLSHTCRTFPRIENQIGNLIEKSLSCACPEVVEMIDKKLITGKLALNNKKHELDFSVEVTIRNTFIKIMEIEDLNTVDKLLVCFNLITSLYEIEDLSEEIVLLEIKKYNDEHIINACKNLKYVNESRNNNLNEVNSLFLDIVENYKFVPILNSTLSDISNNALKMNRRVDSSKWESFIEEFKRYDDLMLDIIISKINSLCLSEDIGETVIAIQLIILEYVLNRHSSYLSYLFHTEISKELIKDYTVVFSRIIENNSEAVLDYIYENFGEEILKMEYLTRICL